MWDNPRLLNSVAGILTGIALLIFMLAGAQLLLRSTLFPLREITVHGTLAHTSTAQIAQATQGRIAGNFFSVDLAAVRQSIEQLPWVRRVNVRRVWPDGLEVSIEEHVALAHWGDDALVDSYGERFVAQTDAALPVLAGPAGTEAEVTRRYRRFAALLAPLGDPLERVILTPRFAWRLKLRSGLSVVLGRDTGELSVEARLARFVAVYPQTLGRIAERHEYVDLRYPNGFALRVSDMKG
ncbi:MAG: cell division protein FtsQ/DivIB [Burkholderiales bacterium]